MTDNNNLNGGSPKFNNGRTAEEKKLLKNNGIDKKIQQMTILEIVDNKSERDDSGGGGDSSGTAGTPIDADHIDSVLVNGALGKKKKPISKFEFLSQNLSHLRTFGIFLLVNKFSKEIPENLLILKFIAFEIISINL